MNLKKKKTIKIGEFFCSHFNIEDRRKKQHFRHIMLHYFEKGKNATEMQKKICAVFGEGAVTDRTCQKWFAKFCAGDFLLEGAPRSGRQVEVDSDQIETLIENNQHYTNQTLKIICTSLVTLIALMLVFHISQAKKNFLDGISTCDFLLKCNENAPFLKQIVTGDEKWILYNNA